MQDNVFQLGKLLFLELNKLGPAFPGAEFGNELSGLGIGIEYLDADPFCPQVMPPAVDVDLGHALIGAFVRIKAHAGQSAQADIKDGADNFRVIEDAPVMELKPLMFSSIFHWLVLFPGLGEGDKSFSAIRGNVENKSILLPVQPVRVKEKFVH